jgi:hypothetical protein
MTSTLFKGSKPDKRGKGKKTLSGGSRCRLDR